MRRRKKPPKVVRRSFALSSELLEEARAVADPKVAPNLNRLVAVALLEFIERRRREEFEQAMDEMGRDPSIRAASNEINREFASAEQDGLSDD